MKLTPIIHEQIVKFEQETGKHIDTNLVPLIEELAACGDCFEGLGARDASSGRPARSFDDFIEWGKRNLNNLNGKENPIVELMYNCYQDGYNAENEADI